MSTASAAALLRAKFPAQADDVQWPEDFLRCVPPPSQPMGVARQFVADHRSHTDGPTLVRWNGQFYGWTGPSWQEHTDEAVRSDLYRYLEHAVYDDAKASKPWAPTARRISDVFDALAACTLTNAEAPAWLAPRNGDLSPVEVVSATNGLLHLPTRTLGPSTPRMFNLVNVPFAYDVNAPPPGKWLGLLEQLWPGDTQATAALQEFFGYVISGRTDLQKMMLLIGPTRAGKGTIARVLRALVGARNVAGPTLGSLSQNFGLQPLLGKSLALVSDARLGGGDANVVVERLLSISGEDTLTVDRKFKEPWTGKLSCRFLIVSNELPRFGDASGAIANRMIILIMGQSFLGKENPSLTEELLAEGPGILNWALAGLDRINATGRLSEPDSSRDAVTTLGDIASPVGAFVRQECETGPHLEMPIDNLYAAYQMWTAKEGARASTAQMFGRDLRAVVPGLTVHQPRTGGRQIRVYRGIRVKPDAQ